MTETPPIDLPKGALEAYLVEALPGFSGPVTYRRFSGGQSNPTYRMSTPGAEYVLRRKPFGDLLPSAHAIEREYRVMAALAATPVPVPRVLHLCEDPQVIGAAFYVMAHVPGRVLFDATMPGMAPAERRATCEALIDTLAALHAVDPAAVGLGDFGRPAGYVARQTARWAKQYRASETTPIPAMDALIARLPPAVATLADETCLVHGDFRLDNAIWDPARPVIRAVLDWELSTLGHPLADLSYFLMTWVFPAGLRYGLADADLQALGIPGLEELAARYAARSGRAVEGTLDLLLAYNVFRLAAILQGVYARGLAGNAADEAALNMGADVPRLAEIALDYADRAGV